MKHPYSLILITVAVVLLAGCSANTARANLTVSATGQKVGVASFSGHLPINCWLETKDQQNLVDTKAYFLKKSTEATSVEESQKWIDLANQISGSGSVLVPLRNCGSQTVTVLDGPFAGCQLSPGQSTPPTRVPVGTLSFNISSTTSSGGNMFLTVCRTIKSGDSQVVLADKTIYH